MERDLPFRSWKSQTNMDERQRVWAHNEWIEVKCWDEEEWEGKEKALTRGLSFHMHGQKGRG